MAGKVRKWGNWEAIEDAFARGGQGLVYRVRNVTNQPSGKFVLKELLNPKRSERFMKEVEAVTRLTAHPNVITVVDYGAFKDPNKPTYVMPEADCSLEAFMASKIPLGVVETLCIFDQIVAGVEHLHRHGIIHRDIKPDNVLMFDLQPKVSDFGLCLITDTPRITPAEEAVGPRFYMAPELEDGRHLDVTLRADIYSLGKVLYFLLSGGKVFSREKFSDPNWNLSVLFDDDRFKIFDKIFRRTIAQENYRYSDCAELRAELSQAKNEYQSNPRTTLEAKLPSATVQPEGKVEQLRQLTGPEWVALLEIRRRNKATYSEEIMAVAVDAISPITANSFGKELLRVKGFAHIRQGGDLASKIITCIGDSHIEGSIEDAEELFMLALDSNNRDALCAITKNALQLSPPVLDKIAERVHELDEEDISGFLIASSNRTYPKRRETLLGLSNRVKGSRLGFVVAGLMDDGSNSALDRIAELLRERTSMEGNSELIQGIVLRGSSEKLEKIVSKGGYSDFMQRMLELILKTSSEVESESAEENDEESNY